MRQDKQHRLGTKLAARPDVHRVRRPVEPGGSREFDLHYVRSGPPSERPVLVIPGGPGLASVLPYHKVRALAAARGLDVIMMEHRGVGLSRQDDEGDDLPWSALTVEQVVADLAAVLDDCRVDEAVVYGSSYGTYLAQGFGARYPDRVTAMVLDSTILGSDLDIETRDNLRRLFWEGADPRTAGVAEQLRTLVRSEVVAAEEAAPVVLVAHDLGGLPLLERLLELRACGKGRRTWNRLLAVGDGKPPAPIRYVMEHDLVAVIAAREFAYQPSPDGHPLELAAPELPADCPPFDAEPYDLPRELPRFSWPTVVMSGSRDLRTPRTVAERTVELIPDAVLVQLDELGHSALDAHPLAALHAAHAAVEGTHRRLPELAPRISALPRSPMRRYVRSELAARLTVERLLPRG